MNDEYVEGVLTITVNTLELRVWYRWDCVGDEPADWKVYLQSDVKEQTDIWPLLSDAQRDEIFEAVAQDARRKV